MKLKVKNIAIFGILIGSVAMTGCSLTKKLGGHSDMEAVAMNVLNEWELVSIKEVVVDENVKKKYAKSNLVISLNLEHSAPSIALDNALLKINRVMAVLEDSFKEKLNDYKFIINTDTLDIYGNEQKVKILEVTIKNEDVDKINFENFNYRNLEKLANIKKYNYLKEYYEDLDKDKNKEIQKETVSKDNTQIKNNNLKEDIAE